MKIFPAGIFLIWFSTAVLLNSAPFHIFPEGRLLDIKRGSTNYKNIQLESHELKRLDGRMTTHMHTVIAPDQQGTYIYFYLKIPVAYPADIPAVISINLKNTGYTGSLGLIYATPKKQLWLPYPEYPFNNNWQNIKLETGKKTLALAHKKNLNLKEYYLQTLFFKFVSSHQPECEFYVRDITIDCLKHNPEATGKSTQDLISIITRKLQQQTEDLRKTDGMQILDQKLHTLIQLHTEKITNQEQIFLRYQLDDLSGQYYDAILNQKLDMLF